MILSIGVHVRLYSWLYTYLYVFLPQIAVLPCRANTCNGYDFRNRQLQVYCEQFLIAEAYKRKAGLGPNNYRNKLFFQHNIKGRTNKIEILNLKGCKLNI
jgi:hypothetical protein